VAADYTDAKENAENFLAVAIIRIVNIRRKIEDKNHGERI
jgi:hypothetical protein